MSLRINSLLFVVLTAVIAVLGDWSRQPAVSRLWLLPGALFLVRLASESWYVSRSAVTLKIETPERFLLGRGAAVRFAFAHAARRALILEFAPAAPDYFAMEGGIVSLRIGAGASAGIERQASAGRLGVFEWPAPRLRIGGPLRLA